MSDAPMTPLVHYHNHDMSSDTDDDSCVRVHACSDPYTGKNQPETSQYSPLLLSTTLLLVDAEMISLRVVT